MDSPERYRLDWPGKRAALHVANSPTTKTLRPLREESVDFENTQNLLVEGNNLDALKLIQQSYLGRVKLIYIDPPYNTGNDYIYADNYSESLREHLENSLQVDSDGNRLAANPDTSGRFHSNWLSMMYPRLKLARNLLRHDGAIFMSIDDGEVHNLRKMADEIFGERNFVSNIIWEKKFSPSSDARWLSDTHDHILLYARNKDAWAPKLLPRLESHDKRYNNRDKDPRGPWQADNLTVKSYSETYDYEIVTPSGRVVRPSHGSCWRVSKERFQEMVEDNRIWFGENGSNVPRMKRFLSEVRDGIVPVTIWKHIDVGHNQGGRQELKKLFEGRGYFDSPKPVSLLRRIIHISNAGEGDIVLDFFSGSGTTGHAVLEANAEDGLNRKFILIQLDEMINADTEAGRAGYRKISEITMERMRLAGRKVLEDECHPDWNRDVGFRALKLDSSNLKDVYYRPEEMEQSDLIDGIDNLKEGREPEDLLFQVLVDWGVNLALPIRREAVQDKTVYFVDNDALVACFDSGVTENMVKELAGNKPLRVVFRDSGFTTDAVKINVEQIFRQVSPGTEVKAI